MKNNPYVGPRPYERADRRNFYGRGREARDLLSLMLAERVLLFYAQSGAGKTSLLNAQVIPALEDKGFDVLPVARVGSELPPGIDPAAAPNIFVFSALMGLAGADVDPQTLLEHTLLSFLQIRCCADNPPLLIFDQFEELFTTHRDRWQEARDFFVQVRQCLDNIPNLGVTLAMREDHIAELDPYAALLPGRLRARFRMERLGPQAAVEAVARPAANAGCPFDPGVAERLVDDLRRIKRQEAGSKIQDAGGKGQDAGGGAVGPYVEPVQLQVVCNRLWERLPDQHDNAIQWAEVEQYGNIDRALVDFYESALTEARNRVSPRNPISERQLRRWFSEELITPMDTRGLVMRGRDDTAGLPNAAVDALEAQHLIRADARAGARWYELCHDRMVDPIVQSNRGWELEQLRQRPPEILAFELDRVAIMGGQEVKLSWQVEGADEVLLEPMGRTVEPCDSLSLSPVETTQYTLKVIKGQMPATISRPQNVIVKKVHPTLWADLVIYIEQNRATPIISKAVNPDSLSILADLPFSVYLTTNYHTLMKDALFQAGKHPETEICYWHDDLDRASYICSPGPDFMPTPECPLVYHFYGEEAYPDSLVLRDDDYMNFIKVQEDRDLVPIEVRRAMYRSWPLLLGYDWQSWEFKALFQGLLFRNLSRRPLGTFQTISDCKESEAVVDMEDYFAKYRFDIYWDDTPDFLQRLWQAWEEK